ncbi:MAG: glutamine-hydrolyzing GMP synthase [Chitinophagaceae bacterium]|nr:MAG: glutamine-hydrolyzing GMP synthase [Chitinophagaceae bacterium]
MTEKIIILDFGSQYTQLIARAVREANVYCEIIPFSKKITFDGTVKGVILSGSPFSVNDVAAPEVNVSELTQQAPVLGVCYGAQLTAKQFGGKVERSSKREYGRAILHQQKEDALLKNLLPASQVWMSHGDSILELPTGFEVLATTDSIPVAAFKWTENSSASDNSTTTTNSKPLGLNVNGIDAKDDFYKKLKGKTDPEKKRKAIGKMFIDIFQSEAKKIKGVTLLGQGTIYPDVIESVSVHGPSVTIKSHHNVGGLPKKMHLGLVEPLRFLFKDEVRKVGLELGIPEDLISRHPFPGPGLAIRILGEVTPEKVDLLQRADDIYVKALKEHNLYATVWQAGAILLPVRSVGVMGDERTYEFTVALRAVTSVDGMTADWAHLPYDFLAHVSNEIINSVRGINRVVYDISSKPPATIEWE